MEYIKVTAENLEQEHICCAITSNKDCQVAATTYALFYDGEFVTNEILSEKKFLKMCGIE